MPERPSQKAAWRAVAAALLKGELTRPDQCSACGMAALVQAHHHNGYEEQHFLDVVWLCSPCHVAADLRVDNGPPRTRSTKTHCKRGHPFTPENTYVYPDDGVRRHPGAAPARG